MISYVTVLYHERPTWFAVVSSCLFETRSLPDRYLLTHISQQRLKFRAVVEDPSLQAQNSAWSRVALSLLVTPAAISNALSSSASFNFSWVPRFYLTRWILSLFSF